MQIVLLSPYDKFIKSCRSEITKKAYAFILNRFMAHYELVDYKDILSLSVKQLEDMVVDYLLYMKKDNLSKSYVTQQIAAIKRFLFMNDVVLNWNKIIEYKGEFKRRQKDEAYSHEQINKILQTCDSRSRVMVLFFASTGIRIGALPELRLKSLKKVGDLYQITIYEGYNEEYTTFCTPECRNAIDDYLEFRSRSGEKITAESYLIRQEFDISDMEQIRKHSKPIASSTIRNVIWRNMVKAGIRDINHSADKHHRKTIPEIHGFRKFFTTQLVNAGLNTEKRWLLEGHSLKGNDNSYVRITEKELLQEYLKVINDLTIDSANKLKIENKKLLEETNQIELLKIKHERDMKQKEGQITALRSTMETTINKRIDEVFRQEKIKDLEDSISSCKGMIRSLQEDMKPQYIGTETKKVFIEKIKMFEGMIRSDKVKLEKLQK